MTLSHLASSIALCMYLLTWKCVLLHCLNAVISYVRPVPTKSTYLPFYFPNPSTVMFPIGRKGKKYKSSPYLMSMLVYLLSIVEKINR